MRMEYLQYLLEIDKQHSISAAAFDLYLGQTTLSSIVKNVEAELGFSIFHRTHSGVQTTPEGEEALALIRDINACYEQIQQLSTHFVDSRPIPLILSPSINAALALPLNQMFLAQEPYGNLEFHSVTGDEVGAEIIKNNGNIGLAHFTKARMENYCLIASKYQIQVEKLMKDYLYLLVREDHPLAQRDSVAPEDVSDCRFAILPHFAASDHSLAHIRSFGTGNRYTVFPNITLIQEAVRSQNMVAILCGYVCGHEEGSALRKIRLDNLDTDYNIYLCLIHRGDDSVRHQEKIVIRCIRELFRDNPMPLS